MKGIASIVAVAVVLIVAGAMVLFGVPQVLSGWANQITGTVNNCNDDPYNAECICQMGVQRKVSVPWYGIPRWHCENLPELLIDPDSPTFESDAITFVQDYLGRYCSGVCGTDYSCGTFCNNFAEPADHSNSCMDVDYGWGVTGARIVIARCIIVDSWGATHVSKSHTGWSMNFFVESKTGTPSTTEDLSETNNFCTDQARTQVCMYPTIPLNVVPNDYVFSIYPNGVVMQ